jgi:hypothetical protein
MMELETKGTVTFLIFTMRRRRPAAKIPSAPVPCIMHRFTQAFKSFFNCRNTFSLVRFCRFGTMTSNHPATPAKEVRFHKIRS